LVSETGVPIRPGFFSTSPARNSNNKNISIIFDIITKFVLDNNIPFLIITYIIEDFDIVFFTETHLDYLIPNVNIKCEGFETPIRKDRNSSGGGIILYCKNYVNISRRLVRTYKLDRNEGKSFLRREQAKVLFKTGALL
jgi:hypothetical protein